MKHADKGITLLEIPDEISLFYSITGCPLRCDGCHSSYLRNPKVGNELTTEVLLTDIKKYENYISTVLFMGGEWEEQSLICLLDKVKEFGLKTALYTGLDDISDELRSRLDYLKTGPYIDSLGGLSSKNTNQRLIHLKSNEVLNYKFQKDI